MKKLAKEDSLSKFVRDGNQTKALNSLSKDELVERYIYRFEYAEKFFFKFLMVACVIVYFIGIIAGWILSSLV